jgi:hypothetical protein
MHFLATSRSLGCATRGPHLHVRRRPDNANRALAKSRFPRSIPVPDNAVGLYADYAHERGRRLDADGQDSPLVFVNLYRPPLGAAMSYPNVKEMFDRLATATGLTVRTCCGTPRQRRGCGREPRATRCRRCSGTSRRRRCSRICIPTRPTSATRSSVAPLGHGASGEGRDRIGRSRRGPSGSERSRTARRSPGRAATA